jgi:Carboxypeptidase regulatory-like domain/TonB-dependent Receptor Plug Domain
VTFRAVTRLSLTSCILLSLATLAVAQTGGTGALTGILTDPSGADIPGGKVTLVDKSTGVSRSTITSAAGAYKFALLTPGDYELRFEASGFQTATIASVTVNVTETPVVNYAMHLGSAQQTLEVNESELSIQTENATLGTLVSGKQLAELPLASRNYTQVLTLSPGVMAAVGNASTLGQGTQSIYVNGNFSEANNFQMDGVPVNNYANGNAALLNGYYAGIPIPSPDALEEFKIQTSQYDAGYGRNPGANVNILLRTGSSSFHGSIFEFLRNDALNANDFFNNRNGVPRGELKQNQFGGTIGGPIWKEKKDFYFLSYQGTRQVNAVSSDGHSTSDLPALTNDRTAATLGAFWCKVPASSGSAPGTGVEGGTGIACDGSNINPVALKILNAKLPNGQFFIPTPQTLVNATTGFSTFNDPGTYSEDQYILNTDWQLTSKHTLSERFMHADNPLVSSFSSANSLPGSGRKVGSGSNYGLLRLTSVLTNNLVNEAKFSYLHFRAAVNTTDPLTSPEVGMTTSSFYPTLPVLTVSGLFSVGGQYTDGARQPLTTLQYGDDLSWVAGRHTIRTGFFADHILWTQNLYGLNRGTLTFLSFNDFLLGLTGGSPSSGGNGSGFSNLFASVAGISAPPVGALNQLRAQDFSAYIQDDIKLTPHFTANLGLRYEYFGQMRDNLGVVPDYFPDIAATVPIPPAAGTYVGWTVPPNYQRNPNNFPLPDGVTVRSTYSGTRNGAPKDNFGPRAAFSFQPFDSGRFVIRGGYGIFYQQVSGDFLLFPLNFSYPNTATVVRTGASNSPASLQAPFTPTPASGWTSAIRTPTSSLSLYTLNPDLVTPTVQLWNLDTQYEISSKWVLDIAYVGSHSTHLNLLTLNDLPQLASPSQPLNCGLPTGCVTDNTTFNVAQRMPIVGIAPTGFNYLSDTGTANYNALQSSLRKQLSHGVSLQAAYTYSKALGDFDDSGGNYGGIQESNYPGDHAQQYGRLDIDRQQRLAVTYDWAIPGYKESGLLKTISNGWRVAGVTTIQGGAPINITDSRGGSIYGFAGTSRAQFAPGKTNGDIKTHGGSLESRLQNYLNPSTFVAPPPDPNGTTVSGSVPTAFGNSGRNPVSGPGQDNTDLSIAKQTAMHWRESYVDFRADFYNAFNHPQFANPASTFSTPSTYGAITSTTVQPRLIQFGLRFGF